MWLNERKYDIVFLQETYGTVEVEDIWKTQWQGKLFFSHGTNRSCGVIALVRSDLDFKLNSVNADNEGRYLIIEAEVQSSAFLLVNIYAPNKVQEQCDFLETIKSTKFLSEVTLMLRSTPILTALVATRLKRIPQKISAIYT